MKKVIFYITAIVFIWACKPEKEEATIENQNAENIIQLSPEQIIAAGIKTARIEKKVISQQLECSGFMQVSPNNKAIVSPLLNGFVKEIFVKEGDYVKAGSPVVSVTHPDFINLQQQYLESKSQVELYEKEFKRQGELTVENAASIKVMEKAQADYWIAQAAYKSTKAQLEVLGINTEKLTTENFIKAVTISAPISGYISDFMVNKGQFLEPADFVCEVLNSNTLQVVLNIFEKDIPLLKTGQSVTFYRVHDTNKIYDTKIQVLGTTINAEDRTIKAICSFENSNSDLHPGMFIKAKVKINEHETLCAPQSAVISQNGRSIVFIKKADGFLEREVKTGAIQDGFVEIINPAEELINSDIVIEGSYFLISDSE